MTLFSLDGGKSLIFEKEGRRGFVSASSSSSRKKRRRRRRQRNT